MTNLLDAYRGAIDREQREERDRAARRLAREDDRRDRLQRAEIGSRHPRWNVDTVAGWLEEFGVRACYSCGTGKRHSRAFADPEITGMIHCSEAGRTRSSLFTWAHELGHLRAPEGNRRTAHAYKSEYVATMFAVRLFQRDGIPVPQKVVDNYRRYVGRKAAGRMRAGRHVDAEIRRWCGL